MASYTEQMAALADKFQFETGRLSYTTKDVAAWALDNGLWAPHRDSMLRQFADDLSRALREQHITDPQGRRVRAKHAIRAEESRVLSGRTFVWRPGEHMAAAFAQRRLQIVADCRQLKCDVDSYNDNQNISGEAIQLVLDFTLDVEELELAGS